MVITRAGIGLPDFSIARDVIAAAPEMTRGVLGKSGKTEPVK